MAEGIPSALTVFFSGFDCWHCRHYTRYMWATQQALLALNHARLPAPRAPGRAGRRPLRLGAGCQAAPALSHMPREIWLRACGYLRAHAMMRICLTPAAEADAPQTSPWPIRNKRTRPHTYRAVAKRHPEHAVGPSSLGYGMH